MLEKENLFLDILDERAYQDDRFGEQNRPNFHPLSVVLGLHPAYARMADKQKVINAARSRRKTLGWDGILMEEAYEAIAESDPARLREELVQVAAVAQAWIEAIDRGKQSPPEEWKAN